MWWVAAGAAGAVYQLARDILALGNRPKVLNSLSSLSVSAGSSERLFKITLQ